MPFSFKSVDEAFSWIESFTNLEKNAKERKRHYRPERMAEVLQQFGNPHLNPKVIHLAGSKGKGSTSVLTASALSSNGWKTGLYTSPHVLHYKERIQIDGSPLDDDVYIRQISFIRNSLSSELPGGTDPTTFELITLLAFLIFKDEACDFAVIETGLGGRLDATNAVRPIASVLTPIELEHTQWLGDTLEAIAREKAGIIKKGVPVFSAPQPEGVEEIFREKAESEGSDFSILSRSVSEIESTVSVQGTAFTIHYKTGESVKGRLAMAGHIQAWNAALSLSVLSGLFPAVDNRVWLKGFSQAVLPGRMEIVSKEPVLVLDGSHTPRSVSLAVNSFQSICPGDREKVLLFACQDDKDALSMAEILTPLFSRVIITVPGYFKESHPRRVFDAFTTYGDNCILEEDPEEALKAAQTGKNDLLIMGSFMLIGMIKEILGEQI
ncbi:MAG: bifunctional folylpolyglutamate synthase/dihydrofolate synthase [Spirochaetales bacterium]|nr:bifunctional folylpolyglutamate synthase/dihydrofolate synthase [Spirochaetales bacterium]